MEQMKRDDDKELVCLDLIFPSTRLNYVSPISSLEWLKYRT